MLDVMSEVAGAAGTAAGLILVFFGAALSGFDSFTEGEKAAVRNSYRWRAWPALGALVAATVSCGAALYAKQYVSDFAASLAVWLLLIAAIAVIVSAIHSALEIG